MNGWSSQYEITFGRVTEAVRLLLIATTGLFVVQWMFSGSDTFESVFSLSLEGLKRGFVWQFATYMFLHGGLFHLFLNLLVLFMMGPETERAMGATQFCILYFVSGILGGLGWVLISAIDNPAVYCVGASGAIFGIIGAFAALFPHRRITLLLFFILPITMKAWVMALILTVVELLFLVTEPMGGGVANAAHLAGGLSGYVYARTVFREGAAVSWRPLPLRRPRSFTARPPRQKEESAADMAEIDRILEKIDKEGMQSLTQAERDRLHKKSRELRG